MLSPSKSQHGNGAATGKMPHAIMRDAQEEQDDILIQQALAFDPQSSLDFNRELEPGEKADDAIDYENISDDDLADEEDVVKRQQSPAGQNGGNVEPFDELHGFTQEGDLADFTGENEPDGDGFDDLFGEMPPSPVEERNGQNQSQAPVQAEDPSMSFDFEQDSTFLDSSGTLMDVALPSTQETNAPSTQSIFRPVDYTSKDPTTSKEQLLQQQLFAMSRAGFSAPDFPPAPPQNQEELLASLWPRFEHGAVPRFMDLLPPKQAHYVGKTPLKKPKPLHITKVSLELAPDQEKSFRVASGHPKRSLEEFEENGLVLISDPIKLEENSEDDMSIDSDFENETIGGITWQDLQMICQDWDTHSSIRSPSPEVEPSGSLGEGDDLFHDLEERWALDHHPVKKRKLVHTPKVILTTPGVSFPSFRDFEQETSKIAKSVTLDLNDPHLLLDMDRANQVVKRQDQTKAGRRALARGLIQRYNVSNDEAYDLLKENHQSKVRSTLGNLTVEHSMPAARLQWPYYKTKLEKQEARSFHRPAMHFQKGEPVLFSKPRVIKRKHLKGKEPHAIFESTKDLSLGDNSNVLLLEYSEEYPAMMSNFGMGSRIINYYRRKNMEDNSRPKLDIGETAVLLPQDKSPFSMFGHVDPGEITPALHNGMYRAPIFKQEAKSMDFLIVRNTTGFGGSTWYMRNIENLHAVGQEFPSVDVPGPHSRKVTTASKNRLKMISYRRIRRNKPHRISVAEITKHFADTTDMQNRQKMKEFLQFSKEHKEWEMRPGEAIPDEDAIRSMIRAEDVCLLESMQVGQQHLQDSGFSKEGEESEDEDGKEGQSIEQQLAPWYTSRNFLHAAQGKAMLQLHGEGDPTGRGEAFSFMKTSMKGGFKAVGESVEDKLDAKKMKELGGHSYNVARQQKAYEESIRRIWDAQKQSLSSTAEHSGIDPDVEHLSEHEELFGQAGTPRLEAQTPATTRRRDDETTSQFSKFSTDSQAGKVLRITRDVRDKSGRIESRLEVIRSPAVIRQYLKRRHAKEAESMKLSELKPTGDADQDRRNQQLLEKELARLERNKDRRIARDKQKGIHVEGGAGSPGSPSSPAIQGTPAAGTKTAGTQRKCANCGQVGHIKTNKKLCPLLNGTMKQEDGFSDSAFAMGAPAL